MKKLIRITTVPISLEKLLEGQLGFMKTHYTVIAVSANASALQKVGQKEGVPVHHIALTREITLLKDLTALVRMYFFLKKEKPSIVHTHTPKAGTVGMLAAWLARVPVRLHTVAGLPLVEVAGAKRVLLNLVEKLTYACATNVYPNSKGLKEIILENNFTNPKKLKVLASGSSNGINTSYFNPQVITAAQKDNLRTTLGITKNDFIFIFVGRLVGDKGINELVAAFSKLHNEDLNEDKDENKNKNLDKDLDKDQDENKDLNKDQDENSKLKTVTLSAVEGQNSFLSTHPSSLLLVGPLETALDPLLPETLTAIKNNKNIISVGWQQDVRPYLAMSHCLAFPSYREGFPNVVMQAGAMGLPSIVSNINGCNEIIEANKNGLIIPVKDEVALYQAMHQVITNKTQYQQLANNARPMITTRYEQQVVWNTILEEYRLLGAP